MMKVLLARTEGIEKQPFPTTNNTFTSCWQIKKHKRNKCRSLFRKQIQLQAKERETDFFSFLLAEK